MAKRTTAEQRTKALEAYATWGTVRRAYLAAGVSRTTVYAWLKDPEFQQAWQDAREDHDDLNYENLLTQSRDEDNRQRFVASATVVNNTHPAFMNAKMFILEQLAMPLCEALIKEASDALPPDAAATLAARITAKADAILSTGLIRKK